MAIYIIFVPVGVFVWDGMGSLPRELFELPFDKVALISGDTARQILDGMECSGVAGALPNDARLHAKVELPMAWNLKPSQWGQPLTFQARPLKSEAGGRPW